ncbi:hypothetical protein KAI78_04930 [bacterium]|nr:hypothetical protein [bacterium]
MEEILYIIMRSIHFTATSFWVGGLLLMSFFILPMQKGSSPDEWKKFENGLTKAVFFSAFLLLITGIFMARSGVSPYAVPRTFVILKVGLTFVMLGVAMMRKISKKKKKIGISNLLVRINMALGILAIVISSIMHTNTLCL